MTSVTIPAGDTASLLVPGTFETFPTFICASGTIDLINGDYRMTTKPVSVAAGTILDMKNHTLMTGAVSRYDTITPQSLWWSLQPGLNSVHNHGTGSVVMTYYAAWL